MTERWLPIPGFVGYDVSSYGRVRSWKRNGPSRSLRATPALRQPWRDKDGYLRITLHSCGQPFKFHVHRLVLETFVGPCPEGCEARHVHDPDPENCHLENLEWASHLDNIRDKYRHGTMPRGDSHWAKRSPHLTPRGSRCPQSKLTEHDAREILRSSAPASVFAARLGVSISTVGKVRTGKNWRHVYEQEQARRLRSAVPEPVSESRRVRGEKSDADHKGCRPGGAR